MRHYRFHCASIWPAPSSGNEGSKTIPVLRPDRLHLAFDWWLLRSFPVCQNLDDAQHIPHLVSCRCVERVGWGEIGWPHLPSFSRSVPLTTTCHQKDLQWVTQTISSGSEHLPFPGRSSRLAKWSAQGKPGDHDGNPQEHRRRSYRRRK